MRTKDRVILTIEVTPMLKDKLRKVCTQQKGDKPLKLGPFLKSILERFADRQIFGDSPPSTPPKPLETQEPSPPPERTLDTSDSQADQHVTGADRGYHALFRKRYGRIPKSAEELNLFKSQRLAGTPQNNP